MFSDITQYWRHAVCAIIVILFSVLVHTLYLTEIPYGIYSDEASVAVNAYSIAETGRDEHGVFMPLYFQAFGEYKNPVYIYSLAFLIKVLGASEFTLRFTSALWFFGFQLGLFFLLKAYFRSFWAGLFGVLVSTVFPLIFPLSRVSFELVSQLATLVWALYFAYVSYTEESHKKRISYSLAGVLFFVLSFFAYSTGRLLIPLFMLLWWAMTWHKFGWREVLLSMFWGLLCVSPLFFFVYTNPTALTARFETLTYLQDAGLSLQEKAITFFQYYSSYFSWDFWIAKGDTNLRHHIGMGGMGFFSVILLALTGIAVTCFQKEKRIFGLYMLLLLLVTPLGAALTEPDHALRVHIMAIFIIFFAAAGAVYLLSIRPYIGKIAMILVAVVFCFEAGRYTTYYFLDYPAKSAGHFEMGNLGQAVVDASTANKPYLFMDTGIGDILRSRLYTEFYYTFLQELQNKPKPEVIELPQEGEEYCTISKTMIQGVPDFSAVCPERQAAE